MAVLSIFNEKNNSTGLPIDTTFTVPSNFPSNQILVVTGSAYSKTAQVQLTVQVVVNSTPYPMNLTCNPAYTHLAFAPVMIPLQLAPGSSVTLTLRDLDNSPTVTDQNDWFSAALIG